MFKKFTNGCVQLVNRWLPDPFIFCIILTIIVFVAAIPATGALSHGFGGILTLVENGWMGGVWSLLAFSMQMALVLVLGNAFASAPIIKKFLHSVAGTFKSPTAAIIGITAISTIACWINWGFGLVVGALLAKEIARQVKGVDYRLLMAAAYSGFVVWHAGFSGSIPLQIASGFTFPNGVEVPAGQTDPKVDISEYVRRGRNRLEIEVATTLNNRIKALMPLPSQPAQGGARNQGMPMMGRGGRTSDPYGLLGVDGAVKLTVYR